jgi:DNA uptake protein ComE-like DNA-binding protein
LLALTPEEIQRAGGLASNPATMQAIIVDDPGDEFDRGRFTIVSPAQVDGLYAGVRFGLENESAKLNLNVLLVPGAEDQALNRLLALPAMTPEIADAILDWIDPDDAPRLNGAEAEVYAQLTPAYAPRNGPIADFDELLLVRGVTPELLYGLDANRNGLLEATEQPRGLLLEIENADGSLNRGWSAYLTVSSVEGMQPPSGSKLIDLNSPNLQELYNELKTAVGDEMAKFIIVYRQYGPQQQPQDERGAQRAEAVGGANQAGTGEQSGSETGGGNQNSGSGGANGGNPGQSNATTLAASAIELKFEKQGEHQINSPLALIAARVQIPSENPGQNNGQPGSGGQPENNGGQPANNGQPPNQNSRPPQNVESPWTDDQSTYREVLKLYDVITPGSARRVAGRVNINAATRPVLRSIPHLPAAAVGKIVSRRELEPDPVLSDQRHAVWLLIEGIVTLEEMKQLERFVTTGGDVFSGQSVGFFDAGPIAARGEFIVDRSGTSPHLRAWRDLSPLGRGFSTELLGVAPAETR